MARTNNLRKLVKAILSDDAFITEYGVKGVYFETGDDDAMYPHIIFSFEQINTGDLWRHDASLIIDIYTKGTSATKVEDMADDIEDMFNAENMPQDSILPTFYLERRASVIDEDKTIKHRQLEIVVQNYEQFCEIDTDGLKDINNNYLFDILNRKLEPKEVALNG